MAPKQDVRYPTSQSSGGHYNVLKPDEVEHFIKHGWVKLSNCFTREQADDVCANIWERLQMDRNNVETWHTAWTALPGSRDFKLPDFAPRAWGAICDLLHEERIQEWNDTWDDDLIVNLGSPEGAGKDIGPREIEEWHIDGDFFVHFLDSPEQGLLVVPLWTDIAPSCGGTMICPGAIPIIALHMYDHPEGVMPDMTPRGQNPEHYADFYNKIARTMPDESFVEITGNAGDVFFLHPLMMHSTSNNKLRRLRVISNPNVQLREPFRLARVDPSKYSIVELSTRQALGGENLKIWGIRGEREQIGSDSDSSDGSHSSSSSDSSSRSSSGSDSASNNSRDGANRTNRKETLREAGKSFLKGFLHPRSHLGQGTGRRKR